jgi:hypothetical protein
MDLSEIGRQFGLNEEQTRAAFDALTPLSLLACAVPPKAKQVFRIF